MPRCKSPEDTAPRTWSGLRAAQPSNSKRKFPAEVAIWGAIAIKASRRAGATPGAFDPSRPTPRMKILLRLLLLALLLPAARAVTMIYPVEGIADLWSLPYDEYREKYAGINITGLGPGDEGWYVRYRHENLTYLFGPLPDREAARGRKWELEAVRDAAIRERPTLSTSRVDVVKFNFSGVYGKRGNQPYNGKGNGGSGTDEEGNPTGGDGDKDGGGNADKKDGDQNGDGSSNGSGDSLSGGEKDGQ